MTGHRRVGKKTDIDQATRFAREQGRKTGGSSDRGSVRPRKDKVGGTRGGSGAQIHMLRRRKPERVNGLGHKKGRIELKLLKKRKLEPGMGA